MSDAQREALAEMLAERLEGDVPRSLFERCATSERHVNEADPFAQLAAIVASYVLEGVDRWA